MKMSHFLIKNINFMINSNFFMQEFKNKSENYNMKITSLYLEFCDLLAIKIEC